MHIRRPVLISLISYLLALLPVAILLQGMAAALLLVILCLMLFCYAEPWKRPGVKKEAYPALTHSLKVGAVIAAWPLLTALWSLTPAISAITVIRTALTLAMALFVIALVREKPIPGEWGRSYALGVCMAIVLLGSELFPWGGALHLMAGVFGLDDDLFFNKNIHRGLCALAVLVWPALPVMDRQGLRREAMWLPLLLLISLLNMDSLSSQTGMVLSMLVFYITCYSSPRISRSVIYGMLVFFFVWPLLFHGGEEWIREHLYNYLPASSQHRVEIWHFTLQKWQEAPLLGWGADTSRVMPGGHAEIRPGLVLMPMHPHNAMLQVLLEQGVIGYLLGFGALGYGVRRLAGQANMPHFLRATLYATVVAYLTIDFSAFNFWQAWWIAGGLVAWIASALCSDKSEWRHKEGVKND